MDNRASAKEVPLRGGPVLALEAWNRRSMPGVIDPILVVIDSQSMELAMADNSSSGALGVVVGALLVIVLVGGGLFLYNNGGGGGSKGPSITIGQGK
jgi:hypothetical protein